MNQITNVETRKILNRINRIANMLYEEDFQFQTKVELEIELNELKNKLNLSDPAVARAYENALSI